MAISTDDARCKGFWNKLTFGWMNKTAGQALKQDLELEELPLPSELLSEAAYNEFQGNWDAAVKAGNPNITRVMLKTFGKDLFLAGLFKLAWSVSLLLGAFFFIRSLQDFVANKAPFNKGAWQGWLLAVGFFVDAYALGMLLQRMFYGCMTTGVRIKGALINAVTKKSFQMSSIDKEHAAECVSFVASDINKVYDGCQDIHFLWTAPIEAGGILIILAILIGVYAFPGWGVVFVVLPAQYLFGWMIIKNKLANSKYVNERSTIFQELLPAMKLVKYYAWERFFEAEVSEIRAKELRIQRNNAWIKTINIMMVFGTPPAAATAIFACYEVFAGQLNNAGSLPFTALALFNVLRFPLVVLPKALRGLSEAIASLRRIQAFLLLDVEHRERATGTSRVGVDMRNCTFKHIRDKGFTLEVPEFNVKSGELVAVVGRVGAGKSSLIAAILGNMDVISGQTNTGGKISYVPQNAWCQALSVRENIMFGMPADDEWYRQVIHDCALELDLQILPKGDLSPVGLRGINLSGGQRQRVNLARAAYFNGDLVLLDNALSAVDHHTANHIFDNLLRSSLREKAIVLITHQVEFLPKCDKVAIMDSGKMLYFGPFTAEAQRLLSQVLPTSHLLAATGGAEERKQAPKKKAASQDSSNLSLSATNIKDQVTKKSAGELTTYSLTTAMWTYCVAGGAILFTLSTFFFMTAQASRQFSDVWIRGWTSNTVFNLPGTVGWYGADKPSPPGSRPQVGDPNIRVAGLPGGTAYVLVYGLIGGVAFWSLMFFRGWTFQGWCRRAGQDLHHSAVHNVLFAPLGFFLRNPVGELLVAFTKENDIMDEALIDTMHYVGIYGLIILSTVITVAITIPMFAVFGGVLILVTLVLLYFYLPAASKLKSMRISTAGAVVGLVAEVLEGLPVINAFDHNRYFVQRAAYLVDQHHRAQFNSDSLNLWLSFYADLYGALLIFGVCIFAVVQRQSLGASAAGLAFSNTIQMLVFYSWTVRGCADTISQFASVEKIAWLARETPQEGDEYIGDGTNATAKEQKKNEKALSMTGKPPSGWPTTGVIEYDNVWMKYGPACPYALKGVTFRIEHSEKVGVVGRTGSGKSTLLLALYRMFELDKGTIKVDGVDVATLKLRELRPKLSVIPQEPVVFSGTVRTNLDPFSEFQDVQLWEVLKKVGLESQVKMTGGLDGKVDGTGGQAWSLGQQQLVCLARAALRNVPILCLDEATASLDPHTEQEVQRIIKKIFDPRTTLTIAHRLDTVIESDQVLVMEAGVLKEMGPSKTLLDNPNSMFSALVDKTGAQAASALRQVAADYFAMRAATTGSRSTGYQY